MLSLPLSASWMQSSVEDLAPWDMVEPHDRGARVPESLNGGKPAANQEHFHLTSFVDEKEPHNLGMYLLQQNRVAFF